MSDVINSSDRNLLEHFILTVGVVSNHGNWFTSNDHNKELKVLAQSYDWLLFLTDTGLSRFINDLLLDPLEQYKAVSEAFINSYTGERGRNRFTKVQILLPADLAIQNYFTEHSSEIEDWFNVISPDRSTISTLRGELDILINKNW